MLNNEWRIRTLFLVVLTILLSGCVDKLFGPLDNAVDPEADTFQGYETVSSPDEIKATDIDSAQWVVFASANDVEGATSYHLQVSGSSDFTILLNDDDQLASHIMIPNINILTGVTYFWRCRVQKNSIWGAWSNVVEASFVGIEGMTPSHGSTSEVTKPTFSWNSIEDANQYEIQIAGTESDVLDADLTTTTSSSYTPVTKLENNKTHYWRLRGINEEGQTTAWSNTHSLGVSWGTISGSLPDDGTATPDKTPSLEWDAVAGAVFYEVQIANTQSGVTGATPLQVTAPEHSYTWSTNLSAGDTRYWRIRAVDDTSVTGSWSEIKMLTVRDYVIGDTGPAGGIVFYDKGSYSSGWRFMEVALNDATFATNVWGGSSLFPVGTSTSIGTGEANTAAIVGKFGISEPYTGGANYAAKLCDDLEYGGYDDWFLPSREDLDQVYFNKDYIDGDWSKKLWSSSEYSSNLNYAWGLIPDGDNRQWTGFPRTNGGVAYARPCRSF